jgi:hypothetical protein
MTGLGITQRFAGQLEQNALVHLHGVPCGGLLGCLAAGSQRPLGRDRIATREMLTPTLLEIDGQIAL